MLCRLMQLCAGFLKLRFGGGSSVFGRRDFFAGLPLRARGGLLLLSQLCYVLLQLLMLLASIRHLSF